MSCSSSIPDDCAKQWEVLLLLISAEEKKIDRTGENEVETMTYFWNNVGVKKIMSQWLKQMKDYFARQIDETDTALKSDDIALMWRLRGNEKFRANLIDESYKCYSHSVLYSYQNGPMYPLALANRSAALLKMKKFQMCLSDLELAIGNNYPVEQRHKLLLRRADCYIELNQRPLALLAMGAANQHATSLNLATTHAMEFDRHIKMLEKKMEGIEAAGVVDEEPLVLPQCYLGDNPKFVSASKAVELRRNDEAGRHVVTSQATRRGDVLFSEEPYAWVTLPSAGVVCEYCCVADMNALPCGTCSRAVYCGEVCRALASATFHKWECVAAQSHILPTIGIAHLALRVLLISTHHGFPPIGTTLSTALDLFESYVQGDTTAIYKSDVHPFYRMFSLVTNFDKMSNTDYVQYALTATMMTLYLDENTSFFDDLLDVLGHPLPPFQLRVFAGAILLRALGQLVCNGHAALTLVIDEDSDCRHGRWKANTVSEREMRRATAIYPSAAMMNHSCDPNIINTFHNRRLIVRCSRELSTGAEVFNCYGPHRAREPTAHRRAQLRVQYLFHCNCTACASPNSGDFVLRFNAYACQTCKGPVVWNGQRGVCAQCHTRLQLDKAVAAIDKANEIVAQAERATTLEEKCDKIHTAYKMKQQVWHRHHTSLREAADRLARLYADIGEYNKSVELIKQNVQSLEYQFGSFSVEVAHELRKLTDVMLGRILNTPYNPEYRDWCLETHKILKKSIQLTELNYGSWEPLVKRLKEQETFVGSLLSDRTQEASDYIHHNLHYNLKI